MDAAQERLLIVVYAAPSTHNGITLARLNLTMSLQFQKANAFPKRSCECVTKKVGVR